MSGTVRAGDMAQARWLAGRRVFVTGGTGFVGRHLMPRLLAAGARLSCLVRPGSPVDMLPPDVRPVTADLLTGEGLAQALDGADCVVHMAALLFGLGWQDYLRANARAAQMLAAALQRQGSCRPRVVLVSSLAAAGPCARAPGLAENAVPAPVSAYGWSKLLVERILGEALGERLVILRPPIIYGSGDKGLLPVFRAARLGWAVSPGYGRRFPVSIVHAQDMAQAILLAATPGASGVYHLNDGLAHDMDSFCAAMGTALGVSRMRVLHMPLPVMALTAALSGAGGICCARLAALAGRQPPKRAPNWNRDKYREARQAGWLCDAGRIRRTLGFAPRLSLEAGMAEAVAGYRREGWL